ncbi:hypothetical protein FIBSPDRAFT_947083 [Athelia psychrophila]|uniref:Uncharacterized protein n=1 Tax=Athelia psychrophila TaxID=1759441 RepID=A0A166S6P1_9AGAM|nr:hypothetical protein FIBSPDRAFT_947083 [Fibularhizoctonia sp. CBS 109695]
MNRSPGDLPASPRRTLNVSIQCAAAAPALSPRRPCAPAVSPPRRARTSNRATPAPFAPPSQRVSPSRIECQPLARGTAPALSARRPSRLPAAPSLQPNPQTLPAFSWSWEPSRYWPARVQDGRWPQTQRAARERM